MDDEAAFDKLSPEERSTVWNETEQSFWTRFADDQRTWREAHDKHTRKATAHIHADLAALKGRHDNLAETQAHLAAELARVEHDLRTGASQLDAKSSELETVDEEYRSQLAAKVADWEKQSRAMANFFRRKRGEPPLPDLDLAANGYHQKARPQLPPSHTQPHQQPPGTMSRLPERTATATPSTNGHESRPHSQARQEPIADVVDADGNIIGPLHRVEPWNQWMSAILRLPIERFITIRRGHRFKDENIASVYERTEAKVVKWLACMIQATGKVQSKRCQSCDKNQGAFEQCVIVGGDLLGKCGNCEWSRRGCHGASGETVDIAFAERKALELHAHQDRQADERAAVPTQQHDQHSVAVEGWVDDGGHVQSLQKTPPRQPSYDALGAGHGAPDYTSRPYQKQNPGAPPSTAVQPTHQVAPAQSGVSGIPNLVGAGKQEAVSGIKFHLQMRQQPGATRVCGMSERRNVDPPPILKLHMEAPGLSEDDIETYLRAAGYVVSCSIYDETGMEDASNMQDRCPRRLTGSLVATSFYGMDELNRKGCFFPFPYLSVHMLGKYRLKFTLVMLNIEARSKCRRIPILAETVSDKFEVIPLKEFPGMSESSQLARVLEEQGCDIPIKKRNGQKERDTTNASENN